MAIPLKYQAKEVLNKVLNTAETALQVDIISGAEYAEDSAHTDEDTGNFILGVRNDVLAELGGTDGDYVPFQMNSSGALFVEVSSSSGDDSIYVDDADWTDSSSKHTLVGGLYQSSPQSITDGDTGPLQVNANGNLIVDLSATDNAVLDAMVVDLAALETLQTSTNTKLDTLETTLTAIETDQAALEVLSIAANVDHAANEALLITIDEDTNAIKGHVDGIETLITSTNSKIDTFDAVLDNILTKNTEIDAVLDTIKIDTEAIETAVELLDNAIDGTEMQVDVVAISAQSDGTYIGDIKFGESLPAGTNNIGDVDVLSIVPGTGATNLGKAEDAVHSDGDTGVMALAVRNDDVAALSGTDGDYSPLQVNAAGALYTSDASGEAGSILVTGTGDVTTTVTANTVFVAIQFITDTVFDSDDSKGLISATNQLYPSSQYESTSIDADAGAVSDGVTFPQGMTIFGRWSGFKLASGSVVAYIGYV